MADNNGALKIPRSAETFANYNRFCIYYAWHNTVTFTPSVTGSVPEHVGRAIVRGDRVILLDNFDVLKDNNVKIFYNIEVRD